MNAHFDAAPLRFCFAHDDACRGQLHIHVQCVFLGSNK
jgi:hypothetical protein